MIPKGFLKNEASVISPGAITVAEVQILPLTL